MPQTLNKLSTIIGYSFRNPDLLQMALSHRSIDGANYERLEFLGDSILNFLIAETFFLKYPHAQEGELSRLRAQFVKGDTLAEIARELGLGPYLNLGPGELKSGGRDRSSILADVVEALLGALYLDGGLEVCREKLLLWFQDRIDKVAHKKTHKDPKTYLQEWVQAEGLELPVYDVIKIEGLAHQQVFSVSCKLNAFNYNTEAKGSTRRRAEQEAANKMLELIEKNK
ncbi:MAG: ribonuclease [Gammaproteobacteria bacterium]|jgi:ribonuclease-3|nr:ribonuclease [Gammaproteobacteria bacterium]